TTVETARAPRAKPKARFRPSGCLILTTRKVTDTAPKQIAIAMWASERVREARPCPRREAPSRGPAVDPADGEGHRRGQRESGNHGCGTRGRRPAFFILPDLVGEEPERRGEQRTGSSEHAEMPCLGEPTQEPVGGHEVHPRAHCCRQQAE